MVDPPIPIQTTILLSEWTWIYVLCSSSEWSAIHTTTTSMLIWHRSNRLDQTPRFCNPLDVWNTQPNFEAPVDFHRCQGDVQGTFQDRTSDFNHLQRLIFNGRDNRNGLSLMCLYPFEVNTTYGINTAGKVDETDCCLQLSSHDKCFCHKLLHRKLHLSLIVQGKA